MPVDQEYLIRRHSEELLRAEQADSDSARQAHLDLAHQYLAEIERLRSSSDDGSEFRSAATA
jgi:hypothetical protein